MPSFGAKEGDTEAQRLTSLQNGKEVFVSAFGDEANAKVKFRTMRWWHVGALMVAETISLGVLGLPHALRVLGIFWGIIVILCFGLLATFTGYQYGQFGIAHHTVASVGDAAEIMFGRWGREIVGSSASLVLIFIMAAHISTFSIAMNVLTNHAMCSVIFGLIGMIVSIICTLPRTLKGMTYFSYACKSIFTDILQWSDF